MGINEDVNGEQEILLKSYILEYIDNRLLSYKNNSNFIIINLEDFLRNDILLKFESLDLKNIFFYDFDYVLNLLKEVFYSWNDSFRDFYFDLNFELYKDNIIDICDIRESFVGRFVIIKGRIEGYSMYLSDSSGSVWKCGKCGASNFSKTDGCYCHSCNKKKRGELSSDLLTSRRFFKVKGIGNQSDYISVAFTSNSDSKDIFVLNPESVNNDYYMMGRIYSEKKKLPNSITKVYYIFEVFGARKIESRVICGERKGYIIEKISSLDESVVRDLAFSMTNRIFGHEIYRIIDFLIAVGLKKNDCDLGDGVNTALHILKVGNASAGKTYMTKQIIKYFKNASFIIGNSTTKAGLLGGVDKDSQTGAFFVRIGEVVKSDDSFIMLDEFDKVSEDTKKGIFTSLSEGRHTLTNIVGSFVYSYNTSFILASNPKGSGKFDESTNLFRQIGEQESFASRVDIIVKIGNPYENYYENDVGDRKSLIEFYNYRHGNCKYESKYGFDEEFLIDYAVVVKEFNNPLIPIHIKEMISRYIIEYTISQAKFDSSMNTHFLGKCLDNRTFNTIIKLSKMIARANLKKNVNESHVEFALDILEKTSFAPEKALIGKNWVSFSSIINMYKRDSYSIDLEKNTEVKNGD